ncbi:MAG: acyl carrier protein [Pirellulales bacterium]
MNSTVTAAVTSAIRAVLADTGRADREITADSLLGTDLGLDSLDVAQAVVLLERSLGVDPFRRSAVVAPLRTVADLVAIYSTALESSAPRPD